MFKFHVNTIVEPVLDGHVLKCQRTKGLDRDIDAFAVFNVPDHRSFELHFTLLAEDTQLEAIGLIPTDVRLTQFSRNLHADAFQNAGACFLYPGIDFELHNKTRGQSLFRGARAGRSWQVGETVGMRYRQGKLSFRHEQGAWQSVSSRFPDFLEPGKEYSPFITLHGAVAMRANIVVDELEISLFKESNKRGLPLEDVAAKQRRLWETRLFTDATITCADVQFSVHRAVLAVASPVFERAFGGHMKESHTATLEIKDSTPAAVEAMLQFIYTGDLVIPGLDNPTSFQDESGPLLSSSEELVPLLSLALLYEQASLSMIVAELLVEGLSQENAQSRSRILKLHRSNAVVKPAFERLLDRLREDDTLLEASL